MKKAIALILTLAMSQGAFAMPVPDENMREYLQESWAIYLDGSYSAEEFAHDLGNDPVKFEKETKILLDIIAKSKAGHAAASMYERRRLDINIDRLMNAIMEHINHHNAEFNRTSLVNSCLKYALIGFVSSGATLAACALVSGGDTSVALTVAPATVGLGSLTGFAIGAAVHHSKKKLGCQSLLKLADPSEPES